MTQVRATLPCPVPPAWAVLERHLFSLLDQAVQPYIERYVRPDGSLSWNHPTAHSEDDFYEAYCNWPLLYLMGGGGHLLERADQGWEGITRQLTGYGLVHQEYSRRDDQFHQAESDIFFYLLCLADPGRAGRLERARRFAGLYLGEDPEAPNWDAKRKLIRSPYNGSGGPGGPFFRGEPAYGWSAGMARYGLPHYDVPGISSVEDLKDPALARRMGEYMQRRLSQGDVAPNLALCSLVTNAYALTGEEKYRRWVLDYAEVWMERARQNQGLLPDNVGLSGQVGEYIEGHWYGGLYGWTWPHGFYNLQMAALVAASCALLLSGDEGYLELPRRQQERILELGEVRSLDDCSMSLEEHWIGQYLALGVERRTFVTPYRYGDAGWFDYQPFSPIYPVALWNLSMAGADWETIEAVRRQSNYDWSLVFPFHTKEDAGHEPPWVRFLAGENPDFPEAMLQAACAQVQRRLALIRGDAEAATHRDVHRWQQANPVTTEALVQLTLGGPQHLYNGGLLLCRLRYFDALAHRPGLPPEVAALVENLEPERTVLRLVNLSPTAERRVVVQAGAFGEHHFTTTLYDALDSEYPGSISAYAESEALRGTVRQVEINASRFEVVLPPATQLRLELGTRRWAHRPSPSCGV
ncbi:MAG: hypothetical protein FJY95_21780 [Candidatus Handelsmanbacteria bacterium]|nr:hypothetical protein [Candidatus Handelsmanbacteria bacterium]